MSKADDNDNKMDEITLKALKESILKWETAEDFELGSSSDCPLCELFHWMPNLHQKFNKEDTCIGCPVMNRTGLTYCNSTPYWDWEKAVGEYDSESVEHCEESRKNMVFFLKSLLPEGESHD